MVGHVFGRYGGSPHNESRSWWNRATVPGVPAHTLAELWDSDYRIGKETSRVRGRGGGFRQNETENCETSGETENRQRGGPAKACCLSFWRWQSHKGTSGGMN